MKYQRYLTLCLGAMVAAAMLTGCGNSDKSTTESVTSEEGVPGDAMGQGEGMPPQKPEGDMPEGGTPPEKPAGDMPEGGTPPGEGTPPEKPSGDMPPGGFGGGGEVTNGTAATTISSEKTVKNETYTSSGDDENALRIDNAKVTLDGISVEKTGGASSNTENGDFYGQNAALLACNGANVTIQNAKVTTNAVNGNGVFSHGEKTTVTISDSTIRTTKNNSGGIQTTGGGNTNARNLDVETKGNSSAAIRSDRGGGTVKVEGGTYVTNGTGSPAVYSTADITVSDATLTANASEGVVVEGKNSVSLSDCDVTGNMSNTYQGDSDENIHCIMIYQSMSGDADVGEAAFSASGGSITAKTGDMFYITNTDCSISLENVVLTPANDVFLRVEGNSSSRGWGTKGANGGDVVLHTKKQKIKGNILVDSISSLNFTMGQGTTLTGTINADNTGGTVSVPPSWPASEVQSAGSLPRWASATGRPPSPPSPASSPRKR